MKSGQLASSVCCVCWHATLLEDESDEQLAIALKGR